MKFKQMAGQYELIYATSLAISQGSPDLYNRLLTKDMKTDRLDSLKRVPVSQLRWIYSYSHFFSLFPSYFNQNFGNSDVTIFFVNVLHSSYRK